MGMIRWEWEGNGNKKVIPAHLYLQVPARAPANVIGCMIGRGSLPQSRPSSDVRVFNIR